MSDERGTTDAGEKRFHEVAYTSEVPEQGSLAVVLPSGDRVCLIRHGGTIYALRDECTHQGMPLSAGEVMPDGTIECPWHGARYDCATGELRRGPAEEPVRARTVVVEGDRVFVAG